jgi:hypothetical protein
MPACAGVLTAMYVSGYHHVKLCCSIATPQAVCSRDANSSNRQAQLPPPSACVLSAQPPCLQRVALQELAGKVRFNTLCRRSKSAAAGPRVHHSTSCTPVADMCNAIWMQATRSAGCCVRLRCGPPQQRHTHELAASATVGRAAGHQRAAASRGMQRKPGCRLHSRVRRQRTSRRQAAGSRLAIACSSSNAAAS